MNVRRRQPKRTKAMPAAPAAVAVDEHAPAASPAAPVSPTTAAPPPPPTPAPPAFGFTAWPTEVRIVTQWFANNPAYYGQFGLPGHEGIDFAAPLGTRIFCVAPGQVKMVHPDPTGHNYGTHVRVQHDQGFETIYAHLQTLQVQVGDQVQAGQVLGLADHTGNADGDHLHLTLKHAGETQGGYPNNIVDPTPYLAPLLVVPKDGATYVQDVVPDGTPCHANSALVETWRLQNSGNTTWGAGYELALCGGDTLGAPASVPLPPAAPNETVDVTITFQMPPTPGRVRSLWQCRNAAGASFGDRVWIDVQVVPAQAPAVRQVGVAQKLGVDANSPIDPGSGAIAPQVADPAILADVGVGWVRLNFILGPWQDPNDTGQHNGRTWAQTYGTIIDGLRTRGLHIYGLINHEALHDAPGGQFRDPPPPGAATDDWLRRYADTFQKIVQLFHDRVDVFETFNEPDNWTRLPGEAGGDPGWHRAWIHPEWFAIFLQTIWNAVHADPQTAGVRIVSGPLEGLDTGNGARDYLRQTYQAGKRRFGWGQGGAPFPFDGVGYHLYIAQDPPNPARDVPAKYNQYTTELRQVIADEEGADKPIFVSEMGWRSSIGESKQVACLQAGLQCMLNDPNLGLGVWFSTQDWGSELWGLYRQGDLSPANRKPSYGAVQSICAGTQTVPAAAWLPIIAGPQGAPAAAPLPPTFAPAAPIAAASPAAAADAELAAMWRRHVEEGLAKNQALFDELFDTTSALLQAAAQAPEDAAERLAAAAALSIVLNTYWGRLAHATDPATVQRDFDEITRAALTQLKELGAAAGRSGERPAA